MEMLGVRELVVRPAEAEEKAPDGLAPAELVRALASHKAREVALRSDPGDIVVAADTIVWLENRVFGKPKDEGEAAAMLRALSGRTHEVFRALSGRTHEVFTGVSVIRAGQELTRAVRSEVRFRALSEREIAAYIATGEPMDKAGAYGAQGKAALFVESITGDFFNVMGLPLCTLGLMLREQGVELL